MKYSCGRSQLMRYQVAYWLSCYPLGEFKFVHFHLSST